MEFTTPFFVRKTRIETIGAYSGREYVVILLAEEKGLKVLTDSPLNEKILLIRGYIDCGFNEKLFNALIALRDSISENQYWVFDRDFPPCYKQGDFIMGYSQQISGYCHKATVDELIECLK